MVIEKSERNCSKAVEQLRESETIGVVSGGATRKKNLKLRHLHLACAGVQTQDQRK